MGSIDEENLIQKFSSGDGGVVWNAKFTPDNIISTTSEGNVIFWDLNNLDALLTSSCEKIRAYLNTNSQVKSEDRKICNDVLGAT